MTDRDDQVRIAATRKAVTWLHKRANEMNDGHAKLVLNSAAFNMSLELMRDAPTPPGRAAGEEGKE